MEEILPGVWHWSTHHEGIDAVVHSAYLAGDPPVVVDPRVPEEGMEVFQELGPPTDALLTNRHHYRHADRFAEAFGTTVRCHGAGLHEFTAGQAVEAFEFDDVLPGGIEGG